MRTRSTRILPVAVLSMLLATSGLRGSEANLSPTKIEFFGVFTDADAESSDGKLVDHLKNLPSLSLKNIQLAGAPNEQNYSKTIDALHNWDASRGLYLARLTPFAAVAAELLGVKFKVLASYESKSARGTTYHSYFAITREQLNAGCAEEPQSQPPSGQAPPVIPPVRSATLQDLVVYLQCKSRQNAPATFLFHNRFSASSYLRANSIYSISPQGETTSMEMFNVKTRDINEGVREKETAGSSMLLKQVAAKGATEDVFAAVWDSTKKGAQDDAAKLAFIQIPGVLPTDLLVCPDDTPREVLDALLEGVEQFKNPNKNSDFVQWVSFGRAFFTSAVPDIPDSERSKDNQAPTAFAELRDRARSGAPRTTIKIDPDAPHLNALKLAVQLAGGEFVLSDEYYRRPDMIWSVRQQGSHEIYLTNKVVVSDSLNTSFDQEIRITFTDEEDLTKRIGRFLHSDMHRIRYVWPYKNTAATVIRDLDFPIRDEQKVQVQVIAWKNPRQNDLTILRVGEGTIKAPAAGADALDFDVDSSVFSVNGPTARYELDPMSTLAYRIVLIRPLDQGTVVSWMLGGALIVFLGLAATAFVIERRTKPSDRLISVHSGALDAKYNCLIEARHDLWQKRSIVPADVLEQYCDRNALEEFIQDLKASGKYPEFDVAKRITTQTAVFAAFTKVLNFRIQYETVMDMVIDPKGVGDAQRLSSTIQFLVQKRLLAPFVAAVTEKTTLTALVEEMFGDLGIPYQMQESFISTSNDSIRNWVSNHFHGVFAKVRENPGYFNGPWLVDQTDSELYLIQRDECPMQLEWEDTKRSINGIITRILLPEAISAEECTELGSRLWVFGRLIQRDIDLTEGDPFLVLTFKPIALITAI
jgi:hypothetical protein